MLVNAINKSENKIPKVIHFCWFGRGGKSELIKTCIKSWAKFLPDWEIREWNEDNYDTTCVEFVNDAYNAKKWAFVSDYVRFDVLYKYGGIYFDTDVELLKPIPDSFFENQAFTGFEFTGFVNPGLVFAARKNFPFLKEILEEYQQSQFIVEGKAALKTVNKYTTELLIKKGLIMNGSLQTVDNIVVFPSDYFCGYDTDVREYLIKDITVSVHHYASSWKKKTKKDYCLIILKNIIGLKLYRKLLLIKRKVTKDKTY